MSVPNIPTICKCQSLPLHSVLIGNTFTMVALKKSIYNTGRLKCFKVQDENNLIRGKWVFGFKQLHWQMNSQVICGLLYKVELHFMIQNPSSPKFTLCLFRLFTLVDKTQENKNKDYCDPSGYISPTIPKGKERIT